MSRPVTILLVEDDKEMREGTADWLETVPDRYEMKVMKAGHGKVALDMMISQTPDLIVSDIMMPEMGGYEFLHEVRRNSDWVHIPFIFLSAKGKEGDIRKGQLSDADLYITKPFKIADLAELIQTQLDRTFDRQKIRAEALESLKKNMLQILNHEFRTPLTYVTAYYDMLENSLDGRNYSEYLRGIQAGCLRLTSLVSDLIMIVELRSGKIESEFRERAIVCEDLSSIIQAAIEIKALFAQEQQVQVDYTPLENTPPIFADPVALQVAFERILDNSLKFSKLTKEDQASVTITTAVHEDEFHIAFKDTGLGIPEHMHQRIFDLFEQYNRNLIEQQGAGTGLTIASGIVTLHRGRIEVESEEDVGSTFTIILPIYKGSPPAGPFKVTPANGRTRATILLVEDDENLLYGLADLLMIYDGKYKIEVCTALNGKQGLEILNETTPDLIISDIMMPQMDGYEFLQTVRKNSEWLDIPFIFLTAKGEKRDKFEGYRLGVEEYITKPYDSDDVLLFIEKRLDKHFQSQQQVIEDFEDLKRCIVNLVTPEFMQPLTAVNIHATRLAKGIESVDNEEDLTASLKEIQGGGVRLNRLIEDFISLAELETGEAAVTYHWQAQPINGLGLLLFELCQVFGRQNFPNIQIDCPFNDQVVPVFGDSSLLMSCIERLIAFSINQAQTRPQSILISATNEKDEVHLSVACPVALPSFAESVLLNILNNDIVTLAELPEYAAGLYIVKGYVGLHNGRFAYKSQLDNGYTLVIALPAYTLPPENDV